MYYYVILQGGTIRYSGNDQEAARDIYQIACWQGLSPEFVMIDKHGRKYIYDYWDPHTDVDCWCPLIPIDGAFMSRVGNEETL